ncbi:MAG: hypothetical protein JXB39_07860 [Deltaproteobacteria bacterium]|nr:hypothetical protein [Deltaproteobacteria bacterium]
MRRHLPSLLLVAVAAGLALWPAPLLRAPVGHPLSDLADHYWGTWWWGGEILAGRLPLRTTITHLPAGQALWYVDPVGAAIGLLVRPLGFPAVYDVVLLVQALAAGGALYLAAWRICAHRGAAVTAGLAGVASPYLLGLVHSGLVEYAGLAAPVLFVLLALEALEGRRLAWLGVATALAASTLQAFYYGAFAALLGACLLVGRRPLERVRRLVPGLALGLALSAPILWVAGASVFGGSGAVDPASAPGWRQATWPAVDLSLFLAPGSRTFPDTPALGNPGILHVHYLGWVLVVLGVAGLARHPRLRPHRWAFLVFGVMALGPALAWGGRPVTVGGVAVPLPLALLYRIPGSPFALVHHPYRFAAFLVPILALGLAASVAALRRWGAVPVGLALLVEGLVASPVPWPLPTADPFPPAIHGALPGPGGVLDWPPDATSANRAYLLWQVSHGHPIPYGVNVFLSEAIEEDPLVADLLDTLTRPGERVRNRDVPGDARFPPPRPDGLTRLAQMGLAWVVLHPDRLSDAEVEEAEAVLVRWLGPATCSLEGRSAWALPADPRPPVIPRTPPAPYAAAPP